MGGISYWSVVECIVIPTSVIWWLSVSNTSHVSLWTTVQQKSKDGLLDWSITDPYSFIMNWWSFDTESVWISYIWICFGPTDCCGPFKISFHHLLFDCRSFWLLEFIHFCPHFSFVQYLVLGAQSKTKRFKSYVVSPFVHFFLTNQVLLYAAGSEGNLFDESLASMSPCLFWTVLVESLLLFYNLSPSFI